MTDNEIIKGLEFCSTNDWQCDDECPFYGGCSKYLMSSGALNIINRQKAEIEQLKDSVKANAKVAQTAINEIKTAKSKAIKEFAERLKSRHFPKFCVGEPTAILTVENINDLVKEMTEVEK